MKARGKATSVLGVYKRSALTEAGAGRNPFRLFREWFSAALSGGFVEPTAMALATSTRGGRPSARMVLLKGLDRRGFVFYTNYESRKGRELAESPHAAAVFWWDKLGRQVRVEGRVEKISARESDEYFEARGRESCLGAWASRQSKVIPGRKTLERRYGEASRRFEGSRVPRPPYWGGYRLIPESMEFWQGRENRLHDRIRFTRRAGSWKRERLSP